MSLSELQTLNLRTFTGLVKIVPDNYNHSCLALLIKDKSQLSRGPAQVRHRSILKSDVELIKSMPDITSTPRLALLIKDKSQRW